MAKARSSEEWDHTASLMALIANVNRDPKKRAFGIETFHPFRQRQQSGIPITAANIRMLKKVFVDKKGQ